MTAEKFANEKSKGLSWRQFFFVLIIVGFFYVVSYLADSFCGGYWLIPEMDGHDELSFGWALHTAFLWQPRFGHEAMGDLDLGGALYEPLIWGDRKFIHPTIYLSDKDGVEKISHLPISKVHPEFRDDYVTDVKGAVSCDETNHVIRCILRLTGSDNPRAVTEIRMNRKLAQKLGVSPPAGFVEKPFADYQKIFKEEYIHWIGKLPLPRDQDVILTIPAKQPTGGSGRISFQCDLNKKSEVNHSKIFTIKLERKLDSQTQ